jgi:hypothetical protein
MSSGLSWLLPALALAASLVLGPRSARAGDATEPIRIEYHAEAGCPSADEFNAKVFRRTSSARLATSGDTARTFIVDIERRANGLRGSLVIRQADGTTESREVVGPECSEVATVLALATALAIDPQASLAAEPVDMPPLTPERSPPPLAKPATESGTLGGASPPPPAEDGAPAPWILALGPSLEAAIAPRVAFGGTVELAWRAPAAGAVSSVGLELTYLGTPKYRSGATSSTFNYIYARPSLCSVALRWQGASGVAPCLATEVGAVTGSGTDVPYGSTRTRLWASVDIGLRLFQTLGSQWFFEIEGGVVLPITQYRFVFVDPSTPVYSVPSAASFASLRVGARLW